MAVMPVKAVALTVFDPTNFAKNAITSAKASQIYGTQMRQYAIELRQYLSMIRNLKRLPVETIQGAIGRNVLNRAGSPDAESNLRAGSELLDIYRSTEAFSRDASRLFEDVAEFSGDMNRVSVGSGLSWEEIFRAEMRRAANGRELGRKRYERARDLNRQLGEFKARADAQLQVTGNAEGAVQAITGLAALSHTMTDQLSVLIAAANADQQAAGARTAEEFKDRERVGRQAEEDRQKRTRMYDYWRGNSVR